MKLFSRVLLLSMIAALLLCSACSTTADGKSGGNTSLPAEVSASPEASSEPEADTSAVSSGTPISTNPEDAYTELLSGVAGDSRAAFIPLDGLDIPLLAITDSTYEDRDQEVTTNAQFYACIDGEVVDVGQLHSGGTAYALSYSGSSIYTANGHAIFRYELDTQSQELVLVETASAVYDSADGSTSCTTTYEGPDADRTADPESALADLWLEWDESQPITFAA